MIEFSNASKTASSNNEEFVDIKKYIGVASIKVVGVNPSNSQLRNVGWSVPVDAKEPEYVLYGDNGKITAARVRFLAEIQDFGEEKPVIALDFWVRPDIRFNSDKSKVKVIDKYGRTAWATPEEVKAKRIPQYSNGPANIGKEYKACHDGEEEIVAFLMKHLNISPLVLFNRNTNSWDDNPKPGCLTIDNWGDLCKGNTKEIQEYLAQQKQNQSKVILGLRVRDDNKSYQTFLNTCFLGNGMRLDIGTGKYSKAVAEIEKFKIAHPQVASQYKFEAGPVHEWSETATEVKDTPNMFEPQEDDLPFA